MPSSKGRRSLKGLVSIASVLRIEKRYRASKLRHHRKYLNKGLTIAELREAAGDIARLLRKKAAILSEGSRDDQQMAQLLIVQAESILAGQVGLVVSMEDETEDEWNNWVCPYWR